MCAPVLRCFGEFLIIVLNLILMLLSGGAVFIGVMFTWLFGALISWFSWSISSEELEAFESMLNPYSMWIGITFLLIGFFMFLIGALGCFGACCHSYWMIATYASFSGIFGASAIAASVLLAVDPSIVIDPLQRSMTNSIQNDFDDPDNPSRAGSFDDIEPVAAVYIAIMRGLPCCGVMNLTDFQYSKKWNRTYNYTSIDAPVQMAQVPVMCCVNKIEIINGNSVYFEPDDTICLTDPTEENSYINLTCFTYLQQATSKIVFWTLISVAVLYSIVFAFAAYLLFQYSHKTIKRDQDSSVELPTISYYIPDSVMPKQTFYVVKRK